MNCISLCNFFIVRFSIKMCTNVYAATIVEHHFWLHRPSPQAHTSPGGASVESATSTIATSPLAQKQTSKRLASMSKGQQPAIRLVGFSGIHGYADLDGLYAENSDDVRTRAAFVVGSLFTECMLV